MAEPATLGPHAVEARRSLVTPEGIDLSLGLATGSQRVGAFIIDLMIIAFSLVALTLLALWIASGVARDGGDAAAEIVAAIWLLGFFAVRNGYFILFEGGKRAATFGKRAMGLRVVARSGERLTLESVVARNMMREIEVFLPITFLLRSSVTGELSSWLTWAGVGWVLIFLLFPLFNRDRLRVGDLLAGTWVVNIPRRRLTYDLVAQGPAEAAAVGFRPDQLDTYGVFELQTLERVLRDDQPETVRLVAATIRGKIGHEEWGDDHEFLTAYYAAARAHMERGLLFGRRKVDKHDR